MTNESQIPNDKLNSKENPNALTRERVEPITTYQLLVTSYSWLKSITHRLTNSLNWRTAFIATSIILLAIFVIPQVDEVAQQASGDVLAPSTVEVPVMGMAGILGAGDQEEKLFNKTVIGTPSKKTIEEISIGDESTFGGVIGGAGFKDINLSVLKEDCPEQ